jgi:hypothetical protein
MRKTRIAALIAWLFPGVGAGQQVSLAFNGGIPDQQSLVNALNGINPLPQTNYQTATNTTAFTATANQVSGAQENFLFLSGTLGAGQALTLPTVANLLAALPANVQANPVGTSFTLRVIQAQSGAFAWTVTTNTGWTLNGTMTVNQNTFRDFIVTITGAATATLQSVGTGTAP